MSKDFNQKVTIKSGGISIRIAVVVIDMVNDFVNGKLGFNQAETIIPKISRVLDFSRSKNIPVIYVCDSHSPSDPELELWGEHAMEGSMGARIVQKLEPKPKDVVLKKRTYDIFFNTGLEELLVRIGVRELALTGVATDICVQNSAAGAFFRGYKLFVIADCVASPDEQRHKSSLEYMARIYGAKIINSGELIKKMGG